MDLIPGRELRASQLAIVVKNLPANAGDTRDLGVILGLGRSPTVGNGNPLQYSCLENPMDRGAWFLFSSPTTLLWFRIPSLSPLYMQWPPYKAPGFFFLIFICVYVFGCAGFYLRHAGSLLEA